jgi:outer membrane protein OmpA-like peptidoglycan-associated protein
MRGQKLVVKEQNFYGISFRNFVRIRISRCIAVICSLICFLISDLCLSQNLVPNPGFEEHVNSQVLTWQQPQGAFYHYSTNGGGNGNAASGQYFNALCLLNKIGSEYLQVKLKQPLKSGITYHLSMQCKLGALRTNGKSFRGIGWHFSNTTYDVKGRTKISHVPEVFFKMDSSDVVPKWKEHKMDYTAKGNEQYLIIGCFFDHDDSLKDIFAAVNKDVELLKKEAKQKQKEGIDSIKKYYNSLPVITKKNKKEKDLKEGRRLMVKMSKDLTAYKKDCTKSLNEKINNVWAKYGLENYFFEVQFCFDDIRITTDINYMPDTAIVKKYKTGQTIVLNNIFFSTAKSTLLPKSFLELDKLVVILKENPTMNISINGHTDGQGEELSNQKLSEDRAKAVRDYLISKGIAPGRLISKGYGETKPVASNDDSEGRRKNRRVEIEILRE